MSVELRIKLLGIHEDPLGKKHVEYEVEMIDVATDEMIGGVGNVRCRLGEQIILRQTKDDRISVNGKVVQW